MRNSGGEFYVCTETDVFKLIMSERKMVNHVSELVKIMRINLRNAVKLQNVIVKCSFLVKYRHNYKQTELRLVYNLLSRIRTTLKLVYCKQQPAVLMYA